MIICTKDGTLRRKTISCAIDIANMNTWNQKIVLVTNSLTYDKTLNV
jgi:hypothetical protein